MRGIFFSSHVITVYLWSTRWGLRKFILLLILWIHPRTVSLGPGCGLAPYQKQAIAIHQWESSSQTHAYVTKPQ